MTIVNNIIFYILSGAVLIGGLSYDIILEIQNNFTIDLIIKTGAVILSLIIFSRTQKGRTWIDFLILSKMEMVKVQWPNLETVLSSSKGVFILILITAILIWIMDSIFLKFMEYALNI